MAETETILVLWNEVDVPVVLTRNDRPPRMTAAGGPFGDPAITVGWYRHDEGPKSWYAHVEYPPLLDPGDWHTPTLDGQGPTAQEALNDLLVKLHEVEGWVENVRKAVW